MPLFVNGYVSPQVFRNTDEITEQSNQEKFRLNYLQEILNEQQQLNDELTGSVLSSTVTWSITDRSNILSFKK